MNVNKEKKEFADEKHWVIIAMVRDRKIQLENRTEEDKDMFGYVIVPGGKVKPDETLKEANKRETLEEYGVKVKNSKKIGIVHDIDPVNGTLYFRHVFLLLSGKVSCQIPKAGTNT